MERHQIDIVCVAETHLNANKSPNLPNYTLYRKDREDAAGGGVGIFVRKTIDHYEAKLKRTNNIEACGVVINTATKGKLTLVSVYKPPLKTLLDEELDDLLQGRNATILAGDLNCKHESWHSKTRNTNGRRLRRYADEGLGIQIVGPTEPTIYPVNGGDPDILDIVVMKDVILDCNLTTCRELSSDHNPVIMELGPQGYANSLRERRTVNWRKFEDHLSATLKPTTEPNTPDEIDQAVKDLEENIKRSLEAATTTHQDRRTDFLRLPEEIKDLIREKNRARRRAQTTLAPEDKRLHNQLTQRVKEAVREHRNSQWEDKIRSLNPETQTLWRMAKALKGEQKITPPLICPGGATAVSPKDKAQAFARTLARQCRPSIRYRNMRHDQEVREKLADLDEAEDEEEPEATTLSEIRGIIKKTKKRKAPGPDGITNRALKALPEKGMRALVNITNAIMRLRHFPGRWKVAEVIEIPKPSKDLAFPENYRDISLLSALGKVPEKVILKRIAQKTEELNVIPDEQFGFRRNHSTEMQVLRLVEAGAGGLSHNDSTAVIFLDVAKAFDKVWHEGLIYKMMDAGYPAHMVKLTRSYLKDRKARVRHEEEQSDEVTLAAGVPQGSLLSPLLFSIFTHDMPKYPGTKLAMYADDTAVMATGRNPRYAIMKLQRAIDDLEDYFNKWKIEVNAEKSAGLLITRRRNLPEDRIIMNDRRIPWKKEVKYLGVVIDQKMTWASHIEQVTRKVRGAMGFMNPLMCRRSVLSRENKLLLYKTMFRPALTYACSAWGYCAPSHLKRLQVVQNKALRMAAGAPWYVSNRTLHQDLQIPTIKEFVKQHAKKTFEKAEEHENPLLREAVDYEQHDRGPKRPRLMLQEENE